MNKPPGPPTPPNPRPNPTPNPSPGAGTGSPAGPRLRAGAWARGVGVVGVVVLVGGLTGASVVWRPGGAPLWLDGGVAVLSVVAAVAQVWWPLAGAGAATVLAALSPAATPAATTGAMQVAQRRRPAVAAGVAAAGFGAHLVRGLWRPSAGISLGWWLVLIFATYGALLGWGALARSRRALLLSLHERAVRAEAEQGRRVAEARMAERRTLAREMHDVLAHRLTLVATHAGALEYRPDASPERVAKAAGVVRAGVHQALEELREVIGLLREDGADDISAPQTTLADVPRLIGEAREAGQHVDLRDEVGDAPGLPAAVGRTAYRVVQEGLTNARKHAPGRPVEVRLHGAPGDRLLIDITNPLPSDTGSVGDAQVTGVVSARSTTVAAMPGSGVGLVGLTERVRLGGGQLDHQGVGGRFALRAWLPWPA
ncbi:sensor histidine kinase [Actinomadura harenae]|uniref:histidine kinase n=1 Tax=Actinomadura harenae TaxID=2483351 RepID=A0A3M2LTB7_9ACTN|nr:histidine kinase [Actinomadura harenae]RMI40346.1 sensor histidine kinase [Actinomadura harenae]